MNRLDGEIALVTGSTKGIGRCIAERFAAEGAVVMVTGRNEDDGAMVVEGIRRAGGRARFISADVADETQVSQLVAGTINVFGGLSILVNNAAPTELLSKVDGAVSELTTPSWELVLRIALSSAFWTMRAALPTMMRNGRGSIVNVSSLAATHVVPGLDAYTAAKGALNALTRSVAGEYARWGIRCNAILVGNVDTGDPSRSRHGTERATFEQLHYTRPGRPDDVAYAAIYLASTEAEIVTGHLLAVDGGASIRTPLPWSTKMPPEPLDQKSRQPTNPDGTPRGLS